MTMTKKTERHGWWTFTAQRDATGRPLEFFDGVPARDLAPEDVAALSEDAYEIVTVSPLYEKAKEPATKDAKGKGSGDATTNTAAAA